MPHLRKRVRLLYRYMLIIILYYIELLHRVGNRKLSRRFAKGLRQPVVQFFMSKIFRMNEIEIFESPLFGQVRIVSDASNEPLFCLGDVCKALGLRAGDVRIRLDKGVVSTQPLATTGGVQKVTFVNEDGLYDVILDSRKPQAKAFRKWLTSEVLPAIRKDGGYIVSREDESDEDLMARALVVARATLKRRDEKIKALEAQARNQQQQLEVKDAQITELNTAVSEMQPKVSYVDTILQCKDTVQTTIIAQDYGKSAKAFNILLRNFGIQRKVGTAWVLYAKHISNGYVQSKTFTYKHKDGTDGARTYSEWTQRGRLFLYDTLKKHGILPMIEQ